MKLDSIMPSDYREELTEEEEDFHIEKEEEEGRVLLEESMNGSNVTVTVQSGPFSDDFTGRYVEKEAFEEQDDPIVQEVLMQVFTAQSQFHEIFGREWGSEDHRDLGSLKDYYFVPEHAVMNLGYLFRDERREPFQSTPYKTPADDREENKMKENARK